jgi:N-acetylmuramoyl-L-alanine amidase
MNTLITQRNNPRFIKWIVVHCTATPQTTSIDSILNYWQKELKWKRPGYHYLIKPNGQVVSLLSETIASNGVKGFNTNSIHISYIGGIDVGNKPSDNRTSHQKNALRVALKILKQKYPAATIQGHKDFPGVTKACPSFEAKHEYADMKP